MAHKYYSMTKKKGMYIKGSQYHNYLDWTGLLMGWGGCWKRQQWLKALV